MMFSVSKTYDFNAKKQFSNTTVIAWSSKTQTLVAKNLSRLSEALITVLLCHMCLRCFDHTLLWMRLL